MGYTERVQNVAGGFPRVLVPSFSRNTARDGKEKRRSVERRAFALALVR